MNLRKLMTLCTRAKKLHATVKGVTRLGVKLHNVKKICDDIKDFKTIVMVAKSVSVVTK